MRVIIRLKSVTASVCQYWLVPGQTISVGRTRAADWTVSGDRMMSGVHFQLACDPTECRLIDLGSTNGTFVNQQRVCDVALREGDQIRAGRSVFEVLQCMAPHKRSPVAASVHQATSTAGPSRSVPRRTKRPNPPGRAQPAAPPPHRAPKSSSSSDSSSPVDRAAGVFPSMVIECPSTARGWIIDAPRFPTDVHDALVSHYTPYIIVSASHAASLNELLLSQARYVYDWIPPSLAPKLSPVLIACQTSVTGMRETLRALWDQQAFFCCYVATDRTAALRRLRLAARGCIDEQQPSDAQLLFGDASPSTLVSRLRNSPAWFVTPFFQDIAAVLGAADGSGWLLAGA